MEPMTRSTPNPLLTSEEFAQRHLVRVRDVKRILKRHKIGEVENGVRRFRESEMVELLRDKLERIRRQRSRQILGNILVVDDDGDNLDLIERTLRGTYTVFRASSGEQALEVFRTQAIEVVLTDQRMPGMTGTEFLSEATRIRPDAVRILLSAYTDPAALKDAINTAKVHYFLSKPITPESLLAKVKEAFGELERVRHVEAILTGDAGGD